MSERESIDPPMPKKDTAEAGEEFIVERMAEALKLAEKAWLRSGQGVPLSADWRSGYVAAIGSMAAAIYSTHMPQCFKG